MSTAIHPIAPAIEGETLTHPFTAGTIKVETSMLTTASHQSGLKLFPVPGDSFVAAPDILTHLENYLAITSGRPVAYTNPTTKLVHSATPIHCRFGDQNTAGAYLGRRSLHLRSHFDPCD